MPFFIGINIGTNLALAEDRIKIIGEDVFPYSFTENGNKKGIDYDLIMEANKRMQIKADITFSPWKRMITTVEEGGYDAGFSVFYKKEREVFGIYAKTPLHYSKYSIFVKKGSEFKFESIKDLHGKTVGNIRGYKLNEEFDRAVSEGKIIVEEANEIAQNAKKLEAGRIDCVLGHHDLMLYTLKKLNLSDHIVPLPIPVEERKSAYLIFSRNGKNIADKNAFVNKYNTVLEEMMRDGTYQKINDKYLK